MNKSRDYQSRLKGVPRGQMTWAQYAAMLQTKAEQGVLRTGGKPIAVYLLTDTLIRLGCLALGEVVPIKMAYHLAALAWWEKINAVLKSQGLPEVDISWIDTPDYHTGKRPAGLARHSGVGTHARCKKGATREKARPEGEVGDGRGDVGPLRAHEDEGPSGA